MSILTRFLPLGGGGATIAKKKATAVLRSDLGHDPSFDAAQTLTAFSPDILPLSDGVERGDIAASFRSFVANPLHAGATNNVWLRAKSFGATSATVSLHEIPNELVLWPQTWAGAPSLGEVTMSAVPGTPDDVLVSEKSIPVVQKMHEGGAHSTLLTFTGGAVRNNTLAPRNWRQLVELIGSEEEMAAYNILSVEPSQEEHELCTRLRIFEDERDSVELRLSLEVIGVPKAGLEGSLEVLGHDGSVIFAIPRTSLKPNQSAPGVTVRLPAGFDGHVKVKLFKAPDVSVCDYASVSVVCTALRSDGTTALLGAEHILFDSAVGLKKYCDMRLQQFANSNFYFRAFMGEGPPPRRRTYAFSPDIQPNGQKPDSNPGSTFANFNVDVASSRGNKIVPNASNFIYTRITALRATSGIARLYAVPSRMLLFPTQYHKFSVWDVVWDKGAARQRQDIAYRGFSSNGPGQLVIPGPFDYFQPAAPGSLAPGSDHYCLIVEAVEGVDPANPNAYSNWPHQEIHDGTSQFVTWLLNDPRVAYRNTSYASTENQGVISIRTDMSPPNMATAADIWYYEVQLKNVPVGSQIEVVARVISSDPKDKIPSDLGIAKQTVKAEDDYFPSPRFTGVGKDFHVLLTISWYPNGKKPNANQNITAKAILRDANLTLMAQTLKPHWNDASKIRPSDLVVFPDYPLFKQDVKGMRTSNKQGYTGLRGAMKAYDAPGTIVNTAALKDVEGSNIVEITVGSDTLVVG